MKTAKQAYLIRSSIHEKRHLAYSTALLAVVGRPFGERFSDPVTAVSVFLFLSVSAVFEPSSKRRVLRFLSHR